MGDEGCCEGCDRQGGAGHELEDGDGHFEERSGGLVVVVGGEGLMRLKRTCGLSCNMRLKGCWLLFNTWPNALPLGCVLAAVDFTNFLQSQSNKDRSHFAGPPTVSRQPAVPSPRRCRCIS